MRSIVLALVVLAGLSILTACGASTPTPTSGDGPISLTTNPNPPQSGDVELVIQVNDAKGQPIPDVDVFISADHTEMEGMNMNGQATAQGGGRYAITAGFEHGGMWKVTVQVKKAPNDMVQEFDLELQ